MARGRAAFGHRPRAGRMVLSLVEGVGSLLDRTSIAELHVAVAKQRPAISSSAPRRLRYRGRGRTRTATCAASWRPRVLVRITTRLSCGSTSQPVRPNRGCAGRLPCQQGIPTAQQLESPRGQQSALLPGRPATGYRSFTWFGNSASPRSLISTGRRCVPVPPGRLGCDEPP